MRKFVPNPAEIIKAYKSQQLDSEAKYDSKLQAVEDEYSKLTSKIDGDFVNEIKNTEDRLILEFYDTVEEGRADIKRVAKLLFSGEVIDPDEHDLPPCEFIQLFIRTR
jgi:hypothetical protein